MSGADFAPDRFPGKIEDDPSVATRGWIWLFGQQQR